MFKEEFPPEAGWFKDFEVRLDLGYTGFDKLYECKKLRLPKRRPKGGELSQEEREENKQKAKERIYVEHSISGIKRYRILSDRLRIKDMDLYNDVLEVCSGLWNFYLDN